MHCISSHGLYRRVRRTLINILHAGFTLAGLARWHQTAQQLCNPQPDQLHGGNCICTRPQACKERPLPCHVLVQARDV